MATSRAQASAEKTATNKQQLDELFTVSLNDAETPDDIAIDNLLEDFANVESAEVKIYRVMPNNKLSYIYSVHPSEFRFDDLRDVYEGGKFRIFVYGIGEGGRKELRASPQFDIEKPRVNAPQIIKEQNQSNDIANIVAQSMQGLGTLMIQGFENLGKMIVANQPEKVDPIAQQNAFLQQMVLMKQIMGGNESPREPTNILEKSLEMLTKGIEMGKGIGEVRGESSTTDVLLETVKSLGPALMAGISQNQQFRPQIPQVPAPSLPPVPGVDFQPEIKQENAPIQPQGNDDVNFIQKQKLKAGLSFLADASEKNLDLTTYAELAIDSLSDDELDMLFAPEFTLEEFAKLEPRINTNKTWFDGLINRIKELLTDDSAESENQASLNNSADINASSVNIVTENTESKNL